MIAPYRVLLTKQAHPRCGRCGAPSVPYTASNRSTRYRVRHASTCTTRLWGRAVQAGAPFAPCEHTNDTHHAPLGGTA